MKHKIIALSIMAMLAGCSTAAMQPIKEGVKKSEKEADESFSHLRTNKPLKSPKEGVVIKHEDSVWLSVQKVESQLSALATKNLARKVAVNRRFLSLNDSISFITALTGVPVTSSFNNTISNTGSGTGTGTGAGAGAGAGNLDAQVVPQLPAVNTAQSGSQQEQIGSMVVYNGDFEGLLNLIAARYNISWEWDGNGIRYFKTKTKTFRLTALPGITSLKARVGTQSAGTGGGAGGAGGGVDSNASSSVAQQESSSEFDGLSVWAGIEDSIKTMLTKDGKLNVTPSTGTITVTDTPEILLRVASFVEEQNKALARQVVINVKVLSVDLTNSDEYGINWNAVYNNINKSLGLSLSNIVSPSVGATNMTLSVLSGSNWEGTTAMIDALSQQGRVSQVTSASLVTLNNQPAPIQVARQTAYLASSQTTIGTAGAGNTTTLQPGRVTTGFSMNMIPHILDNNKLMLQYSGDISSLIRIGQITSNGSTIQTPEVDTRNFLQRVIMNGGETLVVTGFEQFNLSGKTQGVGDAENVALGGQVATSDGKSVLVVLIQPVMSGSK